MPPSDPRIAIALQQHQARNYAAAEQAYRHALSNQPNHPDAMLLMGMLLHETGRHEESVGLLRRGIATCPQPTEFRRALVGPLVALDDVAGAMDEAREVVRRSPASGEAHVVLAQLIGRTGDFAAAAAPARRAAELSPASPVAWVVLARSLANTDRPAEALGAFDRALSIAPTFADAAIERAYLLQTHGRLADAAAGYAQGLRSSPNNVAALNNAGSCHLALGQWAEAMPFFEAAARLAPDDARPRGNVAAALVGAGRIDDALPHLVAAARLDPTGPDPVRHMGACYAAVGDHPRAVEAYRSAVALSPADAAIGSSLLASLLSVDDVAPAALLSEHVAWGDRHADRVATRPRPVVGPADRRLRVGYVSPDFHDPGIRPFIEPVLAAHDRSAVEVVCYVGGGGPGPSVGRPAKLADAWHDVTALDAAATADLIRSHGIDVLVDLAGHTSGNRLAVFARRPAPVQATWLGYPATTGLRAVDYRITDGVADPAGNESFHTETLVQLPGHFAVYADDPAKPYDVTLPADHRGHVTFGAFGELSQVTPATLAAWAAVLAAVPDSRLVMAARLLDNPSTRAAVVAPFAAAGVAADRLDVRPPAVPAEHAALLGTVDLMLDTFPCNGHATTCQAMWMGGPTVTRYGTEFRGRVGLSLYAQLGLADVFAAPSAEAYVRQAVGLATDLSRLRELRPTWRERMRQSPLCDADRFTNALEVAFRRMWAAVAD